MKDAKGHGSDGRGGSSGTLDSAITNFQAAHQAGVNQAAPSQSGSELYAAAMAAAQHAHPNPGRDAYSPADARGITPDFDEMPGVGPDPWYPDRRK